MYYSVGSDPTEPISLTPTTNTLVNSEDQVEMPNQGLHCKNNIRELN